MGAKKNRIDSFARGKLKPFEKYITAYMYSLRALLGSIDEELYDVKLPDLLAIGKAELWPCSNGVVVLITKNVNNEVSLNVNHPLSKTVNNFLASGKTFELFDENGIQAEYQSSISLEDTLNSIIHFGGLELKANGKIYRPKFDNGSIFGWDAKIPAPDEEALRDFRSSFIPRNIVGNKVNELPQIEKEALTKSRSNELLEEFYELLQSAKKEEKIQVFLANHPEFLYPDFIKCYPKFKLGEDYVTDYVLLVQGQNGPEYIFVEIERVDKKIFTNSGQFSASFTQAKDQLLDWDNWLTKNHAYVSSKLPNLFKPQFHLVVGRDMSLNQEQKEKITSEFTSTNRRFSTYDDLAIRFETLVARLLA
ncbi:MAG: hypothetical protein DRR42_21955 [Gammaproteobacteria bacterium]|nr:MAG: hypothetical protein DRR42_21955 [Gammaproteobacteria bacterium]